MKVVNYDINGKVIEDLSTVTLPEDMGRFVYQIRLDAATRIKEKKWKSQWSYRTEPCITVSTVP